MGDLLLQGELVDPPAPVGEDHREGRRLAVIAQHLLDQWDADGCRHRTLAQRERPAALAHRPVHLPSQPLTLDFELDLGGAAAHGLSRRKQANQRRDCRRALQALDVTLRQDPAVEADADKRGRRVRVG